MRKIAFRGINSLCMNRGKRRASASLGVLVPLRLIARCLNLGIDEVAVAFLGIEDLVLHLQDACGVAMRSEHLSLIDLRARIPSTSSGSSWSA